MLRYNQNNIYMKFQNFIFLWLIFLQLPIYGQPLPANRYKDKLNVSQVRKEIAEYHSSFQMEFGLNYTSFQNVQFFNLKKQNLIKPLAGFQARINVLVSFLTFYGQYFSANFDLENYPGWKYTDDTKLKHSGYAFGVHTQLLPFNKISKRFNLITGIAYRSADICANCRDAEDKESHVVKPTNELAWTLGSQIHLSKSLYISIDYNQSLTRSEFKNSSLSYSMGYKYNYHY